MRKFLLFITFNVLVANFIVAKNINSTDSEESLKATICYASPNGKQQISKQISVDLSTMMADEDCGGATMINVGTPEMGTTIGALTSTFPVPIVGTGLTAGAVDVWYKYMSSATATHLTINYVITPVDDLTPPGIIQLWASPCNDMGSSLGTLLQSTVANPDGNNCIAIMPNTEYFIRILNDPGEETDFTLTIIEPLVSPATLATIETSGNTDDDGIMCVGDDLTFNAGPTAVGNTYAWSVPSGANPGNVASFTRTMVTPAIAGTYTVTITNSSGCTSTASQVVVVNPLPITTITETDMSGIANDDKLVCVGGSFTLTATAGFAGYEWALGAVTLPEMTGILTVASATLADAGTYTVTVTDANGCTDTDVAIITINTLPVVNNTTLKVCANADGTGTFTVNHAELTPVLAPPYTPSVNSNTIADIDNGVASGITITYHNSIAGANASNDIAANGNYANGTIIYAKVRNNTTGCYSIAQVTLSTNALPTGIEIQNANNSNSTANFNVCTGSEIELTVNNGTAALPVTYAWDVPGVAGAPNAITFPIPAAVIATHNGTWVVTVTDANGCTATDDIVITVDPNPANDACSSPIALVTGANPGLTNYCATQDLTPCAATSNQASVWYSYTIPSGLKTFAITSTLANGVVQLYQNDCATVVTGTGNCTNTVSLDCPIGQSIRIFVSSSVVDMGAFSLTITETLQTGIDVCSGAQTLTLTQPLCKSPNTFNSDNTGFCPELSSLNFGGCSFSGGPATWYTFTTNANTDLLDIEVTGLATNFGLFTNCSGASLAGSCTTDGTLTNQAVSGSTTYFLVVSGTAGAVGPFTINITEKTDPLPNDACAGAIAVNLGANSSLTNTCATQDLTPCGGSANEASVWYSYTIPAGVKTLVIGTDLTGGNVQVYQADCTTVLPGTTGSCSATVTLDCPEPQVIKIFVSSSKVNSGTFTLTLTKTDQTGIDICTSAQALTLTQPLCKNPNIFNSDNTNFCPDLSTLNFGGCNFSAGPTTWYTFTTNANTDLLDIEITGLATNFGLFTNCAGASLAGSCTTDGTLTNQAVTGGATYFLAVSGQAGAEGPFTINITEKANPPANNLCTNAITLTDNTPVNSTTSCAIPWTVGFCGLNTTTSHTVFFKYTVPATNTTNTNLEFTVTPNALTSGTAAQNDINIGLFTDCTGTVYNASVATGNLCIALGNTIKVNCVAPGTVLTIAVGSANGDEGDFSINVNEDNTGIPVNDLCTSATAIAFTANCDFTTVTGTTVNACPESIAGSACNISGFPTVWYQATIPAGGVGFGFSALTGAPNINIFSNSCTTPTEFGSCITTATDVTNLTPGTYLIAVRNLNVGGPFTFDIKVIVPPANDLCTAAITLSDNVPVNGTTACATPFTPSFCSLSTTTSHTVFYTYTVPASNTTNTNLEFTITPNAVTTGTAASGGISIGLFTDCGGTVYPASVVTGNLCAALGNTVKISCVAPGTVLRIAIGSSNGDEGDFSIKVDEDNTGIPTNDLCSSPTVINIVDNCIFQPVTGTTLNACPESFAGGCGLNTFPTVWYQVVLPPNGIGFGFSNLSAGLNIAIFNNACPPTTQYGSCVSAVMDVTGLTPGTYLIAVRNSNPGSAVSFNIKTILFLPNDNPCAAGFVPTVLSNGSPLAGESNVCATVDNTCAGPVTNSLWYNFTLSAPNDKITINVTGLTSPSIGIYNQANPCNQTPVNQECNGDGMVEFNCLPPGTYKIFMGTSAANAGTFSITATQGMNAAAPNDLCSMATVLPGQPYPLCVNIPGFTSTNLNACPESGLASSGSCNFNTEETSWYTFTAPGVAGDTPTMDFTYTSYSGTGTPFMALFTGSCGALTPTSTGCLSGVNTVFGNIGPLVPGQTYFIALSSFGDTGGNSEFTIKFNLGPLNDDKCANLAAFNLGSAGTLTNQTNDCSGGDYILGMCPPASSENSVWYTFTVDPGSYGINIYVDGLMTNGNPILGPLAAGVFVDGCGSNIVETELCFAARTDAVLGCLAPGTYDLQLSGPSATSGDFSITISQLVDDRVCPVGDLSDVCDDAIVIDLNGIYCTEIPVASCNTDACPEDFIVPGCTFQTDPTVWFTFTVDANAASIDITQMTAGFSYSILSGSPCTTTPPTTITGCLSAPNTPNIPITGGTTYYLIVSSPNDGPFSFNIVQNVFPENDDPNPNSPRPPFVLGIGDGHDGSTCCALGFNDGAGADVPNVSCSGATHDGAVWYRYTTGSEIGFEVTVTPSGSNPISGPTTVEILSGSATAPGGALFTPTSVSCGPAPVTLKVGCFDPGEEVWIKVASATGDCGSFNITINEINQCPLAEECPDATDVIVTNPTDPNCGSFIPVTVQGCLEAACPETEISLCGSGTLPTVWFQVMIDDEAVQLGTSIQSNGTWDPVWAIYYGGCGSLTVANGGTIAMPTPCSNGDSNPDIHTVGTITGETSYWIAVSGEGVIDDPTFTLNVWTSALCVACIGDDGCEPDAEWTITSRSSDRPLDDPFFCQGEDVTVCVNYLYDASETGVDWLHGLIPDFGPGWDMDAFDPSAITVSPGNPAWNDEDDGPCAPAITEQMPYLCTYTDPVTGNLKLCHTGCQICPCAGPLRANAPLPSGWFWSTNGGGGCLNDCSPSTHYGIGQVVVNINFCVDLKVRVFETEAECNMNRSLHFNFQTTSDGVSGCWEDPVAECKLDFAQVGPRWEIDCNRPPRVLGDDVELCTEGLLDIDLTNEDGDGNVTIEVEVIDNPNVTGENNHTFPGGSGTITDYLVNTSGNIEQVLYLATSKLPGFICPSPQDTITVTLYPQVLVNFDQYTTCPENAQPVLIVPFVSGGSGTYTGTTIPFANGYLWSTGQTTPTISVNPSFTTMYGLTVTDDKGCSGTGEFEVVVREPVTFDLDPETLTLCGGFNEYIVSVKNVVANSPGYTVSWGIPIGLSAVPAGNDLAITPGLSNSSFSPFTVSATVVDNFGCSKREEMTVILGEAPQGGLQWTPVPCGTVLTDITIANFYNPSGLATVFTLLDCDGNIVTDGSGGDYVVYDEFGVFSAVNISLNNCFKLQMVTLDPATGDNLCEVVTDEFVIPIPVGTPIQVSPSSSICAGGSRTLSVLNPTVYNGFTWSPTGTGNTATVTVTPLATTQYAVTATQSNGCKSIGSIVVTVNDQPKAGITGSITFCAGESTELTASGGVTYAWSGPASFMALTANTGLINTPGAYTVTVTDANGCTDTESVTISQSTQLTVVIAPLELCDNMVDTLDAGAGFTTYEWKNPTGTVISTTQKVGITQAGTYTVSVTKGTCSGVGNAVVTNTNTPVVNLPDTLTVCRLSIGTGEFPSTINFTSLVSGAPGTWIDVNSAGVNTSDWSNIDFTTTTAAGFFTFKFITNSAIAPCSEGMDSLVVEVKNCLCPNPSINFAPVCNSQNLPVNLNGAWLGNVADGTWTVVAGTTPYPVITNDSLKVLNATPGTYTLRYTYTTPLGTCDTNLEELFTISGASSVTGSDFVLCNQSIGAGPTTVDLNTLISNLVEPTPGSWVDENGVPVTNTLINATGMAVDTLTFTYITTANSPCTPEMAEVNIRIRNCACPDVVLEKDTICNGSLVPLDLEAAGKFMVTPANTTGTWSITAPATVSNGHFVDPQGVPGGTYIATYTLSGSLPNGCQTTFTKDVVIRNQPVVEKNNDGTACSANTGNGATTASLFSRLKPGYTPNGTWTQISPALPQLTIPVNGSVEFVGQTPGTVFTFRYTVNGTAPCTPVSVDVSITVNDCNCPDGNIDCANCDLCNDSGMLDLTTTIVNPATFATGTWNVSTAGVNSVPLINGTILDATGLKAGTYTVTYTLVPAPGGNCPKEDEFKLLIRNKGKAVVNPDTTVCIGATGNPIVDLTKLFKSGDVGAWIDEDGNVLTSTNINFTGKTPGSTIVYTYQIKNQLPCTNSEYPVSILVTDNCNCPPIELGKIDPLCTNLGTLDLKQFSDVKVGNEGTWTASSPALVITNGVLTLTGVPAGPYVLTYTLNNPQTGCPKSKPINITISNNKDAGTARGAQYCIGDPTTLINLFDNLDGESTGGEWTLANTDQTGFNKANGTFNISGRPAGDYVFKYEFKNQAPCPDDSEEVTIKINPLPVADAGTLKNIDCDNQTAVLGTNLTTTGTNIVYEWKLLNVVIGTTKTITATKGGDYTLTVRDTVTNCADDDMVKVIQADDLPTFDVKIDTIACFGQTATITLSNLKGGKSPYQISFDGGTTYGTVLVAANLKSGTYKVQVKDANGCVNDQLPAITIIEPPVFTVKLVEDFFLTIGEDSLLSIKGQYNELTAKSVEWKANGVVVPEGKDKPTLNVKPEVETDYTVTVTNGSGCIATDNVKVSIKRVKPECVPNIFSPNQADANEYFSINCQEVELVTKYRIYDRWGNLLFIAENLSPSNPSSFWDGKFKGQHVVPGVYVYYLEMLFKDGSTEKRGGDVTVIR